MFAAKRTPQVALMSGEREVTRAKTRDALWLTGGQVANRAVRLFVFTYLAHTLGVDAYGDFIYAFRLATIFVGIADFGLELVGIKLQSRYPELHWEIVKRIIGVRLVLATLALALMMCVTWILPEAARLRLPILVFGGLLYLNEVSFNWPFFAAGRVKQIGIANLLSGAGTLFATLVFVKDSTDIYPAILSLLGGIAVDVFFLAARYKRIFFDGRPGARPGAIAQLGPVSATIKDAAPLALSSILFRAYSSAIPVMLGVLVTTRAAGIFDAANLGPQFGLVVAQMLLNTYILPLASRAYAEPATTQAERRSATLWRRLESRLGLGLIGALVLLVFGVPLVAILSAPLMRIGFGVDFTAGAAALVILSARAIVGSINLVYRSLLLAFDRERAYFAVVVGQTVLVVILGAAGVYMWGLTGGAIGLLVSEILAMMGVVIALRQSQSLPGLRIMNDSTSL